MSYCQQCADLESRLRAVEQERDEYRRLYEFRGRALKRPCISCGHVPVALKLCAITEELQSQADAEHDTVAELLAERDDAQRERDAYRLRLNGIELREHELVGFPEMDVLRKVRNDNAALRARVAEMEKALRPFAERAGGIYDYIEDDTYYGNDQHKVGEYRAARAALTPAAAGEQGETKEGSRG